MVTLGWGPVPWEQPSDPRYKSKANIECDLCRQEFLWAGGRIGWGGGLEVGCEHEESGRTLRGRDCKLEILSSGRKHLVAKPAAQ